MRIVSLVAFVLTLCLIIGCSSLSQADKPPVIVGPSDFWDHHTLSVGQKLVVDSLKVTVEFKGVVPHGATEESDTLPYNATVLLRISRNGSVQEAETITNTELAGVCRYSCSCIGIADDLPRWNVCVSKAIKVVDGYRIWINLNRWAYQ